MLLLLHVGGGAGGETGMTVCEKDKTLLNMGNITAHDVRGNDQKKALSVSSMWMHYSSGRRIRCVCMCMCVSVAGSVVISQII